MRPIRLTMSAFGSYAGKESVDFSSKKQGIFLVTGDTGAGKTTIFDAIVYALYDRTSGGVRDGNMMRSAYADLRTATFVELIFSCKGETYRVLRSPDYERESLRKDKNGNYKTTQEKSKVELYLPDDSLFRGNKKQVNQKIEELLGMDARQFMQMAMIAQGDFLRLLHAKSEERREIFSKLFDTGIYGRVAEELRRQEKESYILIREKENACKEQIGRILLKDGSDKSDLWNRLYQEVDVNGSIEFLRSLLEEDHEKEQTLFLKRKNEEEQVQKVLNKKNLLYEIKKIRDKKYQNKEWLELHQPEEEMYEKKEDFFAAEAEKATEDLKSFQLSFIQKKDAFQEQKSVLQKEQKELMGLQVLWEQLDTAQNMQKQKAYEWEAANRQYHVKRVQYECLYEQFFAAQAGILAKNLQADIPCPVCGSREHPSLAEMPEGAPDQEQVKNAKKQVSLCEKNREKCQTEYQNAVSNCQSALGSLNQEGKRLLGMEFDGENAEYRQTYIEMMKVNQNALQDLALQYRTFSQTYSVKEKQLSEVHENKKREYQQIKKAREVFIRQMERIKGEVQILEEQETQYLDKWLSFSKAEKLLTESCLDEILFENEKAVSEIQEKLSITESAYQACFGRNRSNEKTLSFLERYMMEYEELKKHYTMVRHLSQTAGGSLAGSARLDFESYVQRQYFEKIIQRANRRLLEMSSGQFLLRSRKIEDLKKVGKVGLDLDVYSLVTESERDVKTLSGGESFIAALCLALGMADVIQEHSGGIRLETMFIDEGFGSLDEQSRAQAVHVLYRLAGENRLIGIISHVTELKEQLEDKLVVTKGKYGSHVIWQNN